MNRWVILTMLVLVVLILSSCVGGKDANSTPTGTDFDWDMYDGDLIPVDITDLTVLEIKETEVGTICLWDAVYVQLVITSDKLELPTTSGWRIQLDAFSARGITRDGKIIYTTSGQQPLALCLRDGNYGLLECFVREDVLNNFPNAISSGEYDLYAGNELVISNQLLEYAWNVHTSESDMSMSWGVFDGDWSFHSVDVVNKECSALCYEFKYVIIDDVMLYVENMNLGYLVLVSAS